MKKSVAILISTATLIALLGADLYKKQPSTPITIQKKKCLGYTIVEFGKGVDCNGDTIKLTKVTGGQVYAVR
jgi:hypothetical protein